MRKWECGMRKYEAKGIERGAWGRGLCYFLRRGTVEAFLKKMNLNCEAERHHYSMFNVGRSMFDVQPVRSSSLIKRIPRSSAAGSFINNPVWQNQCVYGVRASGSVDYFKNLRL